MAAAVSVADWRGAHPPSSFPPVEADVPQPARLVSFWRTDHGQPTYGPDVLPLPLTPPRLPCDLNAGVPSYVGKTSDRKPGIECVLNAALAAGVPLAAWASGDDSDTPGDVTVTFRSNLNKIGGTLINGREGWSVDACLVGRLLCLDIVQPIERTYPGQETFVAWGAVFEARCTAQAVADTNVETSALVLTTVREQTVLMGAEVDCFDPTEVAAAVRAQRFSVLLS